MLKSIFIYETKIGRIAIAEENNAITEVLFYNEEKEINCQKNLKETHLIKEGYNQIQEYLSGKRKIFNLPLALKGTEFQLKVWNALKTIPYGETRSYKDIAILINREKAARAVGMANNRNPISIIIPCHRVIGSNGKLVGYGGGLNIKEYLLKLETSLH